MTEMTDEHKEAALRQMRAALANIEADRAYLSTATLQQCDWHQTLLGEARKMLSLKHTQETAELAVLLAQQAIAAVETGEEECAASWAEMLAKLFDEEAQ